MDFLMEEENDDDMSDTEVIILQDDSLLKDDDSSDEESDVPLQERWDNFQKNFLWEYNVDFDPIVHEFSDPKVGIQSNIGLTSISSALEIFEFFYSENITDMICNMTNIYHTETLEGKKQSGNLKKRARISEWKEITRQDLMVHYALTILMGLVKKPSIELYWSTDPLIHSPIFNAHMSRDRYQIISRYLHYSEDDNSGDKLRKIRGLFEALNEKFKEAFRPGEKISVDESLVKFKGRLAIRQCNLSKRARFGMKLYKCCDANTGYVYNASVYIGKEEESENKIIGVSRKVVKKMIADLSGFGRTIYLDNWYSSPALFSQLHKKKKIMSSARFV